MFAQHDQSDKRRIACYLGAVFGAACVLLAVSPVAALAVLALYLLAVLSEAVRLCIRWQRVWPLLTAIVAPALHVSHAYGTCVGFARQVLGSSSPTQWVHTR